jgi:hypothetical protein
VETLQVLDRDVAEAVDALASSQLHLGEEVAVVALVQYFEVLP